MSKGKIFLRKVVTGMICICLVSTSLFVEYYEFPLLAAQEEIQEYDALTPSEGEEDSYPSETEEMENSEDEWMRAAERSLMENFSQVSPDEAFVEEIYKENMLDRIDLLRDARTTAPSCGTITTDTVWTSGVLSDGTVTVESGVTLVIMGEISIMGTVTINGGGTIERGSADSYFFVSYDDELVLDGIKIDGKLVASNNPMIYTYGIVRMNGGSTITGCYKNKNGGAALFVYGGTAVLNDAVIENCSSECLGGAIHVNSNGSVTIYDGTYRNNKTTSTANSDGGGFIANLYSRVFINGGNFIGNSSVSAGGCIYSAGWENSQTYLNGGVFSGNKSTYSGYEGSGAVYFNSGKSGETTSFLRLSGDVQFVGDGNIGTDAIYLENENNIPRKLQITSKLNHTVPVYLVASEGRVIAGGDLLLNKEDMEKIKFYDASRSGRGYYAVLDEAANQIYISAAFFTVTYDTNGVEEIITDDSEYKNGDTVTVKSGDELISGGHPFKQWNTNADDSGVIYRSGDTFNMKENLTLHAIYDDRAAVYHVEYYQQSIDGSGYELKEKERLIGVVDAAVEAPEKFYTGFAENLTYGDRNISGKIQDDGSLVLKKYYDRDIYTVHFHLNGAEGTAPDEQVVTYENLLKKVDDPVRTGYVFKGWYTDKAGTEGNSWSFEKAVNENTAEHSVTLYAKWADVTAPVLGEVTYNTDYKNIFNWIVRKKNLILTVPIIEEGSGVKEAVYTLMPEGSTSETAYVSENGIHTISSGEARVETENGQITAKIVIAEDFKGQVFLRCTDHAGNISEKTITSLDGGIIVEDNAPEISYTFEGEEESGWYTGIVTVNVTVKDNGNNKISGGISAIDYQIDDGKKVSVTGKDFDKDIVETCNFDLSVSAIGEHMLSVTAVDNAGNESFSQVQINIKGREKAYIVEHYKQNVTGDGYTLEETENLTGMTGTSVVAVAKAYTGFTENTSHIDRKASGMMEEENDLILKLYYDRKTYEIKFQLNGVEGTGPSDQIVRYGGYVRTVVDPVRKGYTFKGWYTDKDGTENASWYFDKTVDQNTTSQKVTLYAKWADETAPVLGKAVFNKGYIHLSDWIIRNTKLIITVPIIEEGSGVKQADYVLITDDGVSTDLTAKIKREDGQYAAMITIDEEFMGNVTLTCTDKAGNISAEKTIVKSDGGIIVEDNAPNIRFSSKNGKLSDWMTGTVLINVEVEDDGKGRITGGIASVNYQLDDEEKISVTDGDFDSDIIDSCDFTVEISGAGEHTLSVTAIDNAGNKNTEQVTVKIKGQEAFGMPSPYTNEPENWYDSGDQAKDLAKSSEPKTGDTIHIELYATIAMIAGFSYLTLYFATGTSGITEEDIRELIYRLNRWKMEGGKVRKFLAYIAIFFVMMYYYSVGKFATLSWKKVYGQ